ncbi:MAG: hypothetical protein H0W89_01045 [Candidatus Levybacteria bacterium]|nr:hypothetical protein [Candidatus Levybacteria bacterium]
MLTKSDLQLIREVIREEVEVGAKQTRNQFALSMVKLEGRMESVEDRLKNVENRQLRTEMGIAQIRKSLETLDLKIEAFHTKLDKKINLLRSDTLDAIEDVLKTVDELNTKMDKRVTRLEEHTGLS